MDVSDGDRAPRRLIDDPLTAAILQELRSAAAVLDRDGHLLTVNEAFEEFCGHHKSTLIGREVWSVVPAFGKVIPAALAAGCAWDTFVEMEIGGRLLRAYQLQLRPVVTASDAASATFWILTIDVDLSATDPTGTASDSIDPLTNLPTLPLVRETLQGLLRRDTRGVVVYTLDLDGFDRVNSEHGRAVGDHVLIETARRLGRCMRASNILGRVNEDMFIIVVSELKSTEQITAVAQRLITSISEPFEAKGVQEPLMLTASVGIAISPENGNEPDDLIQNAQSTVDYVKNTKPGTYQFFGNFGKGEARERRSRIARLHRAIEGQQFFLQYQPKVSLATGKVTGAEALVRWQDPSSGVVMPMDFIPLAEDSGLIDRLGRQVLEDACHEFVRWQESGLPYLRLAINVSARQIARRSFFSHLEFVLTETGIEPDHLELEITESAVMEQAGDVVSRLRAIRDRGIHLCADDFGTGYASLSYLRSFPLDGIKIDTTFVADIEDPSDGGGLAAGVIAVGHSLGMNVVAEGVETEHQLSFLRWHDCDEVQGYFVSQPLNSDDFLSLAAQDRVL